MRTYPSYFAISFDQAILWEWANSGIGVSSCEGREKDFVLAANGTEAGTTASSKTGRLNEAMSTKDRSILDEQGEDRSASRTEETNLVTEGPMRTALVLPVIMAIFLTAARVLIFAASAILNAVKSGIGGSSRVVVARN